MNGSFWNGRRVLVTGHTGFKGAWLSHWLVHLGAHVTGLALAPEDEPNLFNLLSLDRDVDSVLEDVRNEPAVRQVVERAQPEVVFHLAAQALVRRSFQQPVETYATNVLGTVHVLEAARRVDSVRAVVVVTSDKCYENREWSWGYRENDPLGGDDPYSSSKACAELVVHAYRRSFFENGTSVVTARAGNVIGGGDWSIDRLVPDIVTAIFASRKPLLRNPGAVRPWQHVLEPLAGYLLLGERAVSNGEGFSGAWNFGPAAEEGITAAQVTDEMLRRLNGHAQWDAQPGNHPREMHTLRVDSTKAQAQLGWRQRLPIAEAIAWTADWYHRWHAGEPVRELTTQQIEDYESR